MPDRLRTEIKQRQPFGSIAEEVFLNLLRTTSVLSKPLVDVLKGHELTLAQYNVLRILRGAGESGRTCGEVGERLISRDPDVTRLIDRLERRGLVFREPSREDRRVVTVKLSADGQLLTDALDEPLRAAHAGQLDHMSQEDLETLNSLLETARGAKEPLDESVCPTDQ